MFNNQKYVTKGVQEEIPLALQIIMWDLVLSLPEPIDWLQVFELKVQNSKQIIIHKQEEPEYKKEYQLKIDSPVSKKIYVIDDTTHCTMLLAEEY